MEEKVERCLSLEEVRGFVKEWLSEMGFKRVRILVFRLPTEYRGSTTKLEQVGGRWVERRVLTQDPTQYRNLRSLFYKLLHGRAYKSEMGWILVEDADIEPLARVIERLNQLSGAEEIARIIEAWLPRKHLMRWLAKHIVEVETKLEQLRDELEEQLDDLRKARRIQDQISRLERELRALYREFKRLESEEAKPRSTAV